MPRISVLVWCLTVCTALLGAVRGDVLYDISFDEAVHVSGSRPALGSGPDRISAITSGNPRVSDAEPLLAGNSLELNGVAISEAIAFNPKPGAVFYAIEFEVVLRNFMDSNYVFGLVLDTPDERTFDFKAESDEIVVFRPLQGSTTVRWFLDDRKYHVAMWIDLNENRWVIALDGDEVFRGSIETKTLQGIRFRMMEGATGAPGSLTARAFIDNVAITEGFPPTVVLSKGETPIPVTRAGDQSAPSIAVNAKGEAVVVWESTQAGESTMLHGRRYDDAGVPAGSEIQLNTTAGGGRGKPQVAVQAGGGFLAVWSAEQASSVGWDIFGRLYGPGGEPVGEEFKVNITDAGAQTTPTVAADGSGNFVVVWRTESMGADVLKGRRISSLGQPLTTEFNVSEPRLFDAIDPAVASDPAGNFVVVWASFDGVGDEIFVRRFSAAGIPQGSGAPANSSIARIPRRSAKVGVDGKGEFVVTWGASPAGNGRVYARQYTVLGTPVDSEFLVDRLTRQEAESPSIAMSPSGSFVIVWSSYMQDGNGWAVQGQRYHATGMRDGLEFAVNGGKAGDQTTPGGKAVAMDSAGNFLVTWQSSQDVGGTGVLADKFFLVSRPTILTLPATPVSASTATLRGWVNPQGAAGSVRFEYGLTPTFATTVGTTPVASGITPVEISHVAQNLKAHTTYYYRAVALNEHGISHGEMTTFTTGNRNPAPANDTFHTQSIRQPFTLNVLANDVEPDGDPLVLSLPGFGEPGLNSAVAIEEQNLVYTPKPDFNGNDTFSYRVHDGFGGIGTATVNVTNLPVQPLDVPIQTGVVPGESVMIPTRELARDDDGDTIMVVSATNGMFGTVKFHAGSVTYKAAPGYPGADTFTCVVSDDRGSQATVTVNLRSTYSTAQPVAVAGSEVPGQSGVRWRSFGAPAIFAQGGRTGFLASVGSRQGVFVGTAQESAMRLGTGDAVADENGGILAGLTFKRFFDPVFAGDNFAIPATISGGGVTPQSDSGVWISEGDQLRAIARENGLANGVPGGRFATFHSILMPNPTVVLFTAKLRGTASDQSSGLFSWTSEGGTKLVLQKGQTIDVAGTNRRVRSFDALIPVKGSAGHPRYSEATDLHMVVQFYDGTDAIGVVDAEGGVSFPVSSGLPYDNSAVARRIGIPSIPGASRRPVSRVEMTPRSGESAPVRFLLDHETETVLATQGDDAAGSGGARFGTFNDPVAGEDADGNALVAFSASLKAAGAGGRYGIWLHSEATPGVLQIVARAGGLAPGTDGGSFRKFEDLSVMDSYGLIFTAEYTENAASRSKTRRGCWAAKAGEAPQLVFREGQAVVGSTIRKFHVLGAIPKSFGQGRAWASGDPARVLIYRAYLADGRDVILTSEVRE
jgi:hypothetical protein